MRHKLAAVGFVLMACHAHTLSAQQENAGTTLMQSAAMAADRHIERHQPAAQTPNQQPRQNWFQRHPVLTGALVGLAF